MDQKMARTVGLVASPKNSVARKDYVLSRLGGEAKQFTESYINQTFLVDPDDCRAEDIYRKLQDKYHYMDATVIASSLEELCSTAIEWKSLDRLREHFDWMDDICEDAGLRPQLRKVLLYRKLDTDMRDIAGPAISRAMKDWRVSWEDFKEVVLDAGRDVDREYAPSTASSPDQDASEQGASGQGASDQEVSDQEMSDEEVSDYEVSDRDASYSDASY
jgi:hypothetical protein